MQRLRTTGGIRRRRRRCEPNELSVSISAWPPRPGHILPASPASQQPDRHVCDSNRSRTGFGQIDRDQNVTLPSSPARQPAPDGRGLPRRLTGRAHGGGNAVPQSSMGKSTAYVSRPPPGLLSACAAAARASARRLDLPGGDHRQHPEEAGAIEPSRLATARTTARTSRRRTRSLARISVGCICWPS